MNTSMNRPFIRSIRSRWRAWRCRGRGWHQPLWEWNAERGEVNRCINCGVEEKP